VKEEQIAKSTGFARRGTLTRQFMTSILHIRNYWCLQNVQTSSMAHPVSHLVGPAGWIPGGKATGWRSPLSNLVPRVDSSWNVMAHGDAWVGKWKANWRMEWVASTLHTTSEHGVSSITTADAHTLAASSRLNWRPPADLNGLVRFAEKRNLVSARVLSHFNWPLSPCTNQAKPKC